MRTLSFLGFLSKYVRDLSVSNTNSIYKLVNEAAYTNPRLREPLFLYALSAGKQDLVLRASSKTPLEASYKELVKRYPNRQMLDALARGDADVPPNYSKVWRSYLAHSRKADVDLGVKALVRSKVLAEQQRRGFSTYRLGKETSLNPGNLSAWLRGDDKKVSLATAKAVLDKAQQLSGVKEA